MSKGFLRDNYLYGLVAIVIAALIGAQVYWIMHSMQLEKVAMERRLKEDIAQVARDVEDDAFCFTFNSKAFINRGEGIYIVKQKWKDGHFIGPAQGGYIDTLNLFNLFYMTKDTVFSRDRTLRFEQYSATVDISMKFSYYAINPNIRRRDSSSYDVSNLTEKNFKEVLSNKIKIDDAINTSLLDTLIHKVLLKNRLKPVFEAGIKKVGSYDYEYLERGSDPQHLNRSVIRASMFTDNRFNKPYELVIYIPDSFGKVMRSVSVMLLSSLIIILFLIGSYIYFIRTILNQEKLSEMKDTFINNITHEFRTPITNINLAIENWRGGMNNTRFYMQIIEEENKHIERNVEQILQLATLEYGELHNFTNFDLHKMIEETVSSFHIQLERAAGKVILQLNCTLSFIYADIAQIRNLLYNLIDNAIKYNNGDLIITIRTYDMGDRIVVQLEDNGIGMSSETQTQIFNRFYRGQTGDRHDVKGFGLGLSYVKYIVDIHKGEIYVKSKPGHGTKFTIYLPKKINESA